MEQNNSKKWYNKMWVVILMSLTLFPISLFVIWRNKAMKIVGKIILSILSPFSTLALIGIGVFLFFAIKSTLNSTGNQTEKIEETRASENLNEKPAITTVEIDSMINVENSTDPTKMLRFLTKRNFVFEIDPNNPKDMDGNHFIRYRYPRTDSTLRYIDKVELMDKFGLTIFKDFSTNDSISFFRMKDDLIKLKKLDTPVVTPTTKTMIEEIAKNGIKVLDGGAYIDFLNTFSFHIYTVEGYLPYHLLWDAKMIGSETDERTKNFNSKSKGEFINK